jgi:hypothetical protein
VLASLGADVARGAARSQVRRRRGSGQRGKPGLGIERLLFVHDQVGPFAVASHTTTLPLTAVMDAARRLSG